MRRDATGLLIAALTASAHAIGRGSEAACCTCEPQDGPTAAAAGSRSYLTDRMSRSAHHHHLRVMCWLAWCSRQTSRAPHAGRSG